MTSRVIGFLVVAAAASLAAGVLAFASHRLGRTRPSLRAPLLRLGLVLAGDAALMTALGAAFYLFGRA